MESKRLEMLAALRAKELRLIEEEQARHALEQEVARCLAEGLPLPDDDLDGEADAIQALKSKYQVGKVQSRLHTGKTRKIGGGGGEQAHVS